MRTYEETYERILSKKAIAEKEIKARNKKITTSVTTVSCLSVCLVALFALSNARVDVNPNKDNAPNVYQPVASASDSTEDTTVSTTLTEVPSTHTSAKTKEDVTKPSEGNNDSTISDLPLEQDGSTTFLHSQVMPTDVHGGDELPDWKKEEIDRHRILMVKSAMRAVSEEDVDKIDIDKSYIISLHGKPGEKEQGNEYYLMHLEGDDFFYEVEIDAAGINVYSFTKINK